MLQGEYVELSEMLLCRERRVARQTELLTNYRLPLISFGLNMPGPVKTNGQIKKLFEYGMTAIETALTKNNMQIVFQEEQHFPTGDAAILVVNAEVVLVKKIMTAIEANDTYGRLFDIDVIDTDGKKLSRPVPRPCLLCHRQAQDCARSRRHSLEQLVQRIAYVIEGLK